MMNMNLTGSQPQSSGGGNEDMMRQFMQMFGTGGGLGTAAGGLYGMFNQGKNPATAANNTIGKIPGAVQPYYQPYQDAGKTALNTLQGENAGLLGGTKQNDLGKGFKESPGYQFALQQALQEGNNAAAAGGMSGTPQHQEQNMGVAQGLAAKDYNDYMNRQTNMYNTGYGGTQDINNKGYSANTDMANTTANVLGQQGAYNYAGQAGQNAGKAQGASNLFSGLGMAAGSALGGPAGAGIMEYLTKLFGGGK